MNRFSDEYAKKEIDWYGLKEYEKNGVSVHTKPIAHRQDEFFNKRFWTQEFEVPILHIDNALWMSITPFEVQSMILPIQRAIGLVGTGGLGMGYFALKCAEKKDVEEIRVWENNPHVISFFNECFHNRKGFEKIEIIQADVRDMRDNSFDYFFMDVYQSVLSDKVFEDHDNFLNYNEAGWYNFWCQEKCLLQAVVDELHPFVHHDERELFMEFAECPYPYKGDAIRKKIELYHEIHDSEYVEKVLTEYMGRL